MVAITEDILHDIDNSLCASCFDVLEHDLNGQRLPKRTLLKYLVSKDVSCPFFVTWMTTIPNGEELRGCIGTLSPEPISRLGHYVKLSAFNDPRFEPIVAGELPRLSCGLSLLHSYEKAKHRDDWEIGTHGIIVEFDYNGRTYSATYLPEVAKEHNMTKDVAIKQLIRKAGFRGEINEKLLSSIEVTRYQSTKLRMKYSEYKLLDI